jgi:hypothetical protein
MGRKNDKRTRRTVSFYKVHYGFREPFKVCYPVSRRGVLPIRIRWQPTNVRLPTQPQLRALAVARSDNELLS